MSASLFIKGIKEPIALSDEEGKIAEGLIADNSKDRSSVFSIPGVWTGTKGEMRYVTFQKERTYSQNPDDVPLTPEEQLSRRKSLDQMRIDLENMGILKKKEILPDNNKSDGNM